MLGDWVSPAEAAEYLGVTVKTVLRWCRMRKLVSSKLGHRTIRISAASVEKLMERTKQ
jgi:excisionase family DNA binding protein